MGTMLDSSSTVSSTLSAAAFSSTSAGEALLFSDILQYAIPALGIDGLSLGHLNFRRGVARQLDRVVRGERRRVGARILEVRTCCIEAKLEQSTGRSLAIHLEVVIGLKDNCKVLSRMFLKVGDVNLRLVQERSRGR